MRIEKLTDNKIKVTLTTADLLHLDINIEQLTPDSKELHAFLFHIMETIREKTDFNPYSGQVVVEATPSREGISILVSKLSDGERIARGQLRKISSVRPKVKKSGPQYEVYYFDDFENLCGALVRLQDEAVSECALYRNKNSYCVMLGKSKRLEQSALVLNEFSERKSFYPMQAEHVMEHWTLVADGEKLRSMIDGIAELNRR